MTPRISQPTTVKAATCRTRIANHCRRADRAQQSVERCANSGVESRKSPRATWRKHLPPPSEPGDAYVNASCFDFLLIELVPMAERMAREFEASLDRPSLANKPLSKTANPTTGAPLIATTYDGLPETEVFKDSVYFRLEKLGFRVGQGLSERFSKDRPRFTDHLDVIKFLCKDIWTVVFRKQIDNLKTNHRGVFVLTDNKFKLFSRMSMTTSHEATVRAQPHLIFPCGIIRGVLSSLGIKATVQAETSELPSATFQIKTVPQKV